MMKLLPHRLYELYGLTEGICTVLDRDDAETKVKSVGRATAGNEIKIVAEDGKDLPIGEVGEIAGKGVYLSMGYYGLPEKTKEVMKGGWLLTGDLGYLDDDGFLYLVDRKKDMLIVGGVNVYPKDIEEVVAQHPAVAEVAVFGVPNEKWGEAVVAMVVPRGRVSLEPKELMEWVNARVGAKFQRLRHVMPLAADAVPRNVAGKVLKRTLRADFQKTAVKSRL